jgi:hypothetical protein
MGYGDTDHVYDKRPNDIAVNEVKKKLAAALHTRKLWASQVKNLDEKLETVGESGIGGTKKGNLKVSFDC